MRAGDSAEGRVTSSGRDAECGRDGSEGEHVRVLEEDEVGEPSGEEARQQTGLVQQGVHL